MSKLPLIPILLGVGALAWWKSRQAAPVNGVAGLGHGHGGGGGGGHGGGRGGFRGGWGGPYWATEYPDYAYAGTGPTVVDCYRTPGSNNITIGVPDPKDTTSERIKCLVDANGTILQILPTAGVNGLGKFSIKKAAQAAAATAKAPLQIAATPLRVAASPMTAAFTGARVFAQTGSIKAGTNATSSTLKREVMTPLTVPIKALQPLMTKSMSQSVSRLGNKPGLRLALGRPKPGSRQPTAIVSSATQGPTADPNAGWAPVDGRPGWTTSVGSDGSTIFQNTSTNQSFYCTSSDMASIGSPQGCIDLFTGVPTQSPGIMPAGANTAPTPAPDTSSVPTNPIAVGPNDPNALYQADASGTSFTDPNAAQPAAAPAIDPSTGFPIDPSTGLPVNPQAALVDPTATDPATVMQQYQPAAVAPAAGGTVHPLVIVGTLIAVPLAFMMTGKH